MDLGRRNTKKYGFRLPNVEKLRELASLVKDPSNFRKRYGKLLTILNTNVDEGLLKILVRSTILFIIISPFQTISWCQLWKSMQIFWVS